MKILGSVLEERGPTGIHGSDRDEVVREGRLDETIGRVAPFFRTKKASSRIFPTFSRTGRPKRSVLHLLLPPFQPSAAVSLCDE